MMNFVAAHAPASLLPLLLSCFERQHALPTLADYELLRSESAEMAWIPPKATSSTTPALRRALRNRRFNNSHVPVNPGNKQPRR